MRYDPAGTVCSKGPQPGATALMMWLLGSYPEAKSLGIFNCRPTRGGTKLSLHGEGRALDVAFPLTKYEDANPTGTALAHRLVAHADELGVQLVIFNRKIWSANRANENWRAYTGSAGPHLDHLHVELCWDAAKNLTGPKIQRVLVSPLVHSDAEELLLL